MSGDSEDGSFTTATAAAAVAKDEAVAAVELEGAMEQLQAMGFDAAENPHGGVTGSEVGVRALTCRLHGASCVTKC